MSHTWLSKCFDHDNYWRDDVSCPGYTVLWQWLPFRTVLGHCWLAFWPQKHSQQDAWHPNLWPHARREASDWPHIDRTTIVGGCQFQSKVEKANYFCLNNLQWWKFKSGVAIRDQSIWVLFNQTSWVHPAEDKPEPSVAMVASCATRGHLGGVN